jgi:DNA repair photolyase
VEPDAPPIPSRWAAVERLSRAGLRVTIGVAPLMPVHDPQAFARRARSSGASGAWVGGLRLLKADPFRRLLVERDWLNILDPFYSDEIRAIFREVFPSRKADRARPATPPPVPVGLRFDARQPGLFDAAV